MIAFGGSDDLRATARARAARGEWGVVRALLSGDVVATIDPEMLLLAAEADLRLSRPSEAAARLRSGESVLARSGDAAASRRAANLLGAAAFELGDLEAARTAFARALELASAEEDHLLVARATNNLGAIANLRGDGEAALAHFHLAIPAYQQLGHTAGLAESWHNIAIAHRDAGRLAEADDCERRAIEFAADGGSDRVAVMARAGRAEISLRQGDARLAERGAVGVVAEYRRLEDPIGVADALRLVAEARVVLEDPAGAVEAVDAAIELAARHDAALVRAEALRVRAKARSVSGDPEGARQDAMDAIAAFLALGATDEVARTRQELALYGL